MTGCTLSGRSFQIFGVLYAKLRPKYFSILMRQSVVPQVPYRHLDFYEYCTHHIQVYEHREVHFKGESNGTRKVALEMPVPFSLRNSFLTP